MGFFNRLRTSFSCAWDSQTIYMSMGYISIINLPPFILCASWPHQATNDHRMGHLVLLTKIFLSSLLGHQHLLACLTCSLSSMSNMSLSLSYYSCVLSCLLQVLVNAMSSYLPFVINVVINDNYIHQSPPLSLMATNIPFLSPFDINDKGSMSH